VSAAEPPPTAGSGDEDRAVEAAGAKAGATLARGARRVGALTMLSRVLGLVREQIFAVTLGAGGYSDAFLAAFRIPNLLRDLFAEGALSTAFVPTYVRTLKHQGRTAAFALANRVLTTLTLYLGTLAGLAMLFPGPVVHVVASGFTADKAHLTAGLVRIMMPFLPLISVAVVAMGALNAEERYTAPALASSMFNVAAILGGAAVWLVHPSPLVAVFVWAGLTLVGGLAQLGIQIPTLWRLGFRPRFSPDVRLRDPGTRRIAALMAPATLGVAAVQINVVVSTTFASAGVEGSISWLGYAFRLMQLPIGVFGVAISTTSLTQLSRDAAAGDRDALAATLRRGMQMVLFLTVPSTVGLAILGEPIIRLIFQHGRFSAHATVETARALTGYTVGLVSYSAIKVVASAFYALGRTRVPLAASLSAVAANLLWNILTFHRLGHVGLALGTSIAATVNLAVLLVALQVQVGGVLTAAFLNTFARIVLSAAAMAAVLWPMNHELQALLSPGLVGTFASVILPVAVGIATYFGCSRLLKVAEATLLVRRFR
jgi:putative peptidoglycan lipid II flippase